MPSIPSQSVESPMARLRRKDPLLGEYIDFPEIESSSPFKLSKQFYVQELAKGTAVGIHQEKEYPIFFKLFRRYTEAKKLRMKLSLRQTAPNLWLLMARNISDPKPGSMLTSDFREHGRYKWYAEQLEKGISVSVETRLQATKTRRAWLLYVFPSDRIGRDCILEPIGKKWRAFVRAI